MANSRTSQRTRNAVTQLAARLLASDAAADFRSAKRKAAVSLGIDPDRFLPTNQEVQQALMEYQRLFHAESQPVLLARLRSAALQAMNFLHEFAPRLVGPVLAGTATANSEVLLHVFCDNPEQISLFLQERGIPFEQHDWTVKLPANRNVDLPAYRFAAGDVEIVLVAFHARHRHLVPLSQIDGRPLRRAAADEVAALLPAAS
jgi:hypothetical protein